MEEIIMTENTKPTIAQLVTALKEFNGLEISSEDITEEIYSSATKGYERGVSLKSMANRARFYLAGSNKEDSAKETVPVKGVFLGSKDIATEKKPLGKNKAQTISFLQEGDDGFLRVFSEPNTPSHFKGFKKQNFGALVEADFSITKNSTGTYVSPENVNVLDKGFELDTSKIKVYDINALPELEDFTPCAVVGSLGSIRPARIPPWEMDKYDDEDYPLTIKKNPVFTLFLKADTDEGEPIVKAVVNPTHLAKPYINLEDFDAIWPTAEELEGLDEDFLRDEITPMYNDVDVIIIGQKKRSSEFDDITFVDFDVNAIIQVVGEPSIIEVASGVSRAKAAKENKAAKQEEDAAAEAQKMAIRQKKVAEVVTAMMDSTTVQMVRDMVDAKFFAGVDDAVIQTMIDKEFEIQGVTQTKDDAQGDADAAEEQMQETGYEDIWG